MKYIDYLINELRIKDFKYDDVGIYSFSKPKEANIITKIIINHLDKINKNSKYIIITDTTAGIGGNIISFTNYFLRVNAIELDNIRYKYLKNNSKNYNNIVYYNSNFLDIIDRCYQDVIFIDPPWGGKNYKKIKTIEINISNKYLDDICNELSNKCLIIVLKLPINYNINNIKKINGNIYKYNLSNMIILIIETKKFISKNIIHKKINL